MEDVKGALNDSASLGVEEHMKTWRCNGRLQEGQTKHTSAVVKYLSSDLFSLFWLHSTMLDFK